MVLAFIKLPERNSVPPNIPSVVSPVAIPLVIILFLILWSKILFMRISWRFIHYVIFRRRSTPRDNAGIPSVTRFSINIWAGINGDESPEIDAKKIARTSAKFPANTYFKNFVMFLLTVLPSSTALTTVLKLSSVNIIEEASHYSNKA